MAKSETVTSQSNNISLDLVVKLISEFDGNHKRDLHTFIESCNDAWTSVNENQKIFLFKFIKSRISGKASLIISSRQLKTWPELRDFLSENFAESKLFSQIQLELQSCIQHRDESVTNFTQRIERTYSSLLRAVLADCNDDTRKGQIELIRKMALNQFLIGIKPSISSCIRSQNPKTFEEASFHAANEEKLVQYREMHQSTTQIKNNCSYCKKSGHSSLNCYKLRDNSNHQVNHFQSKNNRNNYNSNNNNSKSENSSSHYEKFCNYCKKSGHIISECRKREYNNKMRQNTNSKLNSNYNSNTESNSLNSKSPAIPTHRRSINIARVEF